MASGKRGNDAGLITGLGSGRCARAVLRRADTCEAFARLGLVLLAVCKRGNTRGQSGRTLHVAAAP
jgi:hypothetical protein